MQPFKRIAQPYLCYLNCLRRLQELTIYQLMKHPCPKLNTKAKLENLSMGETDITAVSTRHSGLVCGIFHPSVSASSCSTLEPPVFEMSLKIYYCWDEAEFDLVDPFNWHSLFILSRWIRSRFSIHLSSCCFFSKKKNIFASFLIFFSCLLQFSPQPPFCRELFFLRRKKISSREFKCQENNLYDLSLVKFHDRCCQIDSGWIWGFSRCS